MYVYSAGICVVNYVKGTAPKYLLLRCYSYWDFPKGELNPRDSQIEAAMRETFEETNLGPDALKFDWGMGYKETEPYKSKRGKKIARYFLARVVPEHMSKIYLPLSPELGRPEHDEFRWCTYEEAKERLNDRVFNVLTQFHATITKDQ